MIRRFTPRNTQILQWDGFHLGHLGDENSNQPEAMLKLTRNSTELAFLEPISFFFLFWCEYVLQLR